jgi:hypothetical protein
MVSDVRSGRWITPLLPPGPILPTKESTLRMHTTPTRGQQRREPDVRHPRWLPEGADVLPQGGVHFRVWASKRHRVEVVLEGGLGRRSGASPVAVGLEPEGTGYFSGLVADAAAVTLYRYRLNGEAALYADPASRFQPDGPHGPHKSLIQAFSRGTKIGSWITFGAMVVGLGVAIAGAMGGVPSFHRWRRQIVEVRS